MTGERPDEIEADLLKDRFGSARVSHPEEYVQAIQELENAGVEIVFRPGQLAYSPVEGRPGRMILDSDASIGAIRHELRHFRDVRQAGFPGLAYYYARPREFARLEARGYLEEMRIAEELGAFDLVPRIVDQMKWRIRELLGRTL